MADTGILPWEQLKPMMDWADTVRAAGNKPSAVSPWDRFKVGMETDIQEQANMYRRMYPGKNVNVLANGQIMVDGQYVDPPGATGDMLGDTMDLAGDAIPATTSALGAAAGSALTLNPLGLYVGGGTGGAFGDVLRQKAAGWAGSERPYSPMQTVEEAAFGAGGELVGKGVGAVGKAYRAARKGPYVEGYRGTDQALTKQAGDELSIDLNTMPPGVQTSHPRVQAYSDIAAHTPELAAPIKEQQRVLAGEISRVLDDARKSMWDVGYGGAEPDVAFSNERMQSFIETDLAASVEEWQSKAMELISVADDRLVADLPNGLDTPIDMGPLVSHLDNTIATMEKTLKNTEKTRLEHLRGLRDDVKTWETFQDYKNSKSFVGENLYETDKFGKTSNSIYDALLVSFEKTADTVGSGKASAAYRELRAIYAMKTSLEEDKIFKRWFDRKNRHANAVVDPTGMANAFNNVMYSNSPETVRKFRQLIGADDAGSIAAYQEGKHVWGIFQKLAFDQILDKASTQAAKVKGVGITGSALTRELDKIGDGVLSELFGAETRGMIRTLGNLLNNETVKNALFRNFSGTSYTSNVIDNLKQTWLRPVSKMGNVLGQRSMRRQIEGVAKPSGTPATFFGGGVGTGKEYWTRGEVPTVEQMMQSMSKLTRIGVDALAQLGVRQADTAAQMGYDAMTQIPMASAPADNLRAGPIAVAGMLGFGSQQENPHTRIDPYTGQERNMSPAEIERYRKRIRKRTPAQAIIRAPRANEQQPAYDDPEASLGQTLPQGFEGPEQHPDPNFRAPAGAYTPYEQAIPWDNAHSVLQNILLSGPANVWSDLPQLYSEGKEMAMMTDDDAAKFASMVILGGAELGYHYGIDGSTPMTPEAKALQLGLKSTIDDATNPDFWVERPVTSVLNVMDVLTTKLGLKTVGAMSSGIGMAAMVFSPSMRKSFKIFKEMKKLRKQMVNLKPGKTLTFRQKEMKKLTGKFVSSMSKAYADRLPLGALEKANQLSEARILQRNTLEGGFDAEAGHMPLIDGDVYKGPDGEHFFMDPPFPGAPITVYGRYEDALEFGRMVAGPAPHGPEHWKTFEAYMNRSGHGLEESVQTRLKDMFHFEGDTPGAAGAARAQAVITNMLADNNNLSKMKKGEPNDFDWYIRFKNLLEPFMAQKFMSEAGSVFSILSPKKPVEVNLAEMFWVIRAHREHLLEFGGEFNREAFTHRLLDMKTGDTMDMHIQYPKGRMLEAQTHGTLEGGELPRLKADRTPEWIRRNFGEPDREGTTPPAKKKRSRIDQFTATYSHRDFAETVEGQKRDREYPLEKMPIQARDKDGNLYDKEQGMMFSRDQIQKIADYYETGIMSGDLKTSAFVLTLMMKKQDMFIPFAVNDVQVAKIFGLDQFDEHTYRVVQHWTAQAAQNLGISVDQAQAALWAYGKHHVQKDAGKNLARIIGGDPRSFGSFERSFEVAKHAADKMKSSHEMLIRTLGNDDFLPDVEGSRVSNSGKYPITESNISELSQKHADQDPLEVDVYKASLGEDLDPTIEGSPDRLAVEFVPGKATDILAKLHTGPYEKRLEYHEDMVQALTNPETGKFEILEQMGIDHEFETQASAYYNNEGGLEINPAVMIKLADGASRQDAEVAASMLGFMTHQEAVAGYRPAYKASGGNDSFRVEMGRPMTPEEIKGLYAAVDADQPGASGDIAVFPKGGGVDIKHLGFSDKVDYEKLAESIEAYYETLDEEILVDYFTTGESIYKMNDWKGSPNGEDYQEAWQGYRAASGEGGPDLLRGVDARVGARVQAVYDKWSSEGFGSKPTPSQLLMK